MSGKWDFFKESDSSFGLFYPKNYIVAAFDTEPAADTCAEAMREAGFADDDVRTASGSYVVDQLESEADAGWLDRVKAQIAKTVGTEAGYIDDDVKHARRGGAFLFVYVPEDALAERASEVLKRQHPVYARRYRSMAIERIIYPKQAAL